MYNKKKDFYDFGPFRLDPVKRRLLRDGEPVPLTPKAFDTLLVLVEQSGKTIEKDDLMQQVWPDTVVEENNLTQNISALRKALGDRREESRYIATIPGVGYRFVATVKEAPSGEAEPKVREHRKLRLVVGGTIEGDEEEQLEKPSSMETEAGNATTIAATAQKVNSSERFETLSPPAKPLDESAIAALRRHRKVAALLLGLVIILAGAIAFSIYKLVGPAPTRTAGNGIEVTPLTRTGTIGIAAISPDGRYVVYSVRGVGRESLWLRQVAASSAQQIVPPAQAVYKGLTFSRDGNHIYFAREEVGKPAGALYKIAALGGAATRLLEGIDSVVTFSPDSSRMAFVRNSGEESALIIANDDGGDHHKLAARPMTDYFKTPAWSPDGKVIACSAGSSEPYEVNNTVIVVRVEDGTQTLITSEKWEWAGWVEWLADGSGLLITARRLGSADQIWHVSYPGGAARRITGDSKTYMTVSLTADSRTMAAVQTELNSEIWVVPDADAARARKITSGIGSYSSACLAPDGRIVYSSAASGDWNIWVMNADGSGQKQLTAGPGVNLHQTVSPDGRYILFASTRSGTINVWRMDMDGDNLVQLTRGGGEKTPQCSPDGKWVVYLSVDPKDAMYSVWKVPIDGGEPVRLTDGNSGPPVVSPDAKHIAYFYSDKPTSRQVKIAVIPFAGGPPEMTFDVLQNLGSLLSLHWSTDGQALTYAADHDGVANVWAQPLDGSPPKQLTDFKGEGKFLFDWSRDGKQMIITRRFWPSDLMLLRNFAPGKTQ